MPKRIDLEQSFVEALKIEKIQYFGKIFSLDDTNLCADYIFDNNIVLVMDKYNKSKMANIQKFKKHHPEYNIIILTEKCDGFINDKCVSEIYDNASLKKLIKKLK